MSNAPKDTNTSNQSFLCVVFRHTSEEILYSLLYNNCAEKLFAVKKTNIFHILGTCIYVKNERVLIMLQQSTEINSKMTKVLARS